jgi:hypothetical protein
VCLQAWEEGSLRPDDRGCRDHQQLVHAMLTMPDSLVFIIRRRQIHDRVIGGIGIVSRGGAVGGNLVEIIAIWVCILFILYIV